MHARRWPCRDHPVIQTWSMPSNLKDTLFHKVNSPRWLPVEHLRPSGVHARLSMLHRIWAQKQAGLSFKNWQSILVGYIMHNGLGCLNYCVHSQRAHWQSTGRNAEISHVCSFQPHTKTNIVNHKATLLPYHYQHIINTCNGLLWQTSDCRSQNKWDPVGGSCSKWLLTICQSQFP